MAQIMKLNEDEGGITCMSVDNIQAKKKSIRHFPRTTSHYFSHHFPLIGKISL